jgi:hypothetical protein
MFMYNNERGSSPFDSIFCSLRTRTALKSHVTLYSDNDQWWRRIEKLNEKLKFYFGSANHWLNFTLQVSLV